MSDTAVKKAEFDQHRNDMSWRFYAGEDGTIRWSGYDDSNWWNNVSPTDHARNRVGKVTGRTYRLDHETNEIEISEARSQQDGGVE